MFMDCLVIATVFCFKHLPTMSAYSSNYNHIKEDVIVRGGERVIKLSLSLLARNNHKFINIIQDMVIKNL